MNRSVDRGERVAAVPVVPGIFVLRYFASSAAPAPRLFVRVSPSSENSVALIFAPGSEAGVLPAPGTYALVVAERGGRIHLTIVGAPGEDDGAEVKIEPFDKWIDAADASFSTEGSGEKVNERPVRPALARRRPRPPALVAGGAASGGLIEAGAGSAGLERSPAVGRRGSAKAPNAAARRSEGGAADLAAPGLERAIRPELNASGFGFVCHVARKGDIGSAGGGWVGGPGSPSVIEGVTLHWDAPAGLALEYQALVSGAQGQWSAWVPAGAYAGTRGRALPLAGLRVRIAGDSEKRFRLLGKAIFLGLPAVVESGESLEFSSYAGVDPLVGLRLDLVPAGAADAPAEMPAAASAPGKKIPGIRRLQVFKGMRGEERAV